MTSPLPPILPGNLLGGRYEVRRELGRGGMGVVYLCRDSYTGELTALKRLQRGEEPADPEDAWWFQQEARCLASLDHPSIVKARDFGVLPDGTPFLVQGVKPSPNMVSAGVGVTFKTEANLYLYANYDATVGIGNTIEHTFSAGLRFRF